MLRTIAEKIAERLTECGVENVFTCFDNIPISEKGSGIFTVVGIEGFESYAPIYSEEKIYIPFRADSAISITAPKKFSMTQLYAYFDEKILPALSNTGGMTCSIKGVAIKNDRNIGKLSLKCRISFSGIHSIQRRSA